VIRIDLHLHSRWSPDSSTTLEDLIARCREVGLDRIALTDHNTAEGALELARREPALAIVGQEVRTTEGEILALFIDRTLPRGQRPEVALDLIHQLGGLACLAHPLDRFRASFAPHRVVELAPRVDIIETYNPWCRAADNRAAAELCAELGKPAAAGSDAHSPAELGLSWMEMEEFDSPQDFLAKLVGARHVITELSGSGRRA
jgi:predicted metal-dependent phosphoesterase TrpH